MKDNGNILVIKHGALGDFVQATGAFAAIRQHYPSARITLLTAPAFRTLAMQAPWFDHVQEDERLPLWRFAALRRWIHSQHFDIVIDLQNTDRTGWYYRLLWPHRPPWSGYVRGCTWPHRTAHRGTLHTVERLKEQLSLMGIQDVPEPSLSWLPSLSEPFDLPEHYALLVPGGAPHRPAKRWPAEKYALLGSHLLKKGVTPVLVGTRAEQESIEMIAAVLPGAVNLLGRTTIPDLYHLARKATVVIGNDTGPMHLASLADNPTIVLYSHASNPARCGQRGADVRILRVPDLRELALETVVEAMPKPLQEV